MAFEDYLKTLESQSKTGLGTTRLKELYGDLRDRVSSTVEGQKSSSRQRFRRFGSPVVGAYEAKLDRSRTHAVAEGTSSINAMNEQTKQNAQAQLPQAYQMEEERKNRWYDALGSLVGVGSSLLSGGLYDLLGINSTDNADSQDYTGDPAVSKYGSTNMLQQALSRNFGG